MKKSIILALALMSAVTAGPVSAAMSMEAICNERGLLGTKIFLSLASKGVTLKEMMASLSPASKSDPMIVNDMRFAFTAVDMGETSKDVYRNIYNYCVATEINGK